MMGYNQLYELFDIKYVYLSAIAFFEAGSLICGLAPNSYTFIIGRAVAGVGSAGINAGFMTYVTFSNWQSMIIY
jgi:MFS family permease